MQLKGGGGQDPPVCLLYLVQDIANIIASNVNHTAIRMITTVTVNFSINPYSAGIDFSRQNLTSIDMEDVRFWRLKSIPVL